jgi:hypothetical protein
MDGSNGRVSLGVELEAGEGSLDGLVGRTL